MKKICQRGIKKTLKVIFALIIVLISLSIVGIWWLADDFATPKRRVLQPYHHKILNNPENEGVSITSYPCASGKAPCLFITPDKKSHQIKLTKRAWLVRHQLQHDFGRDVTPYTEMVDKPKGIVVLLHGRHGRKEDLLPVAIRMVASGFVCVLIDLPNHGESPIIGTHFGTEFSRAPKNSNDLNNLVRNQSDQENANFVGQSLLDMKKWLNKNNIDNVETLPTFLWGMSMGGSYANYVVGSESNNKNDRINKARSNWSGLIIVSSFADMQQLVSGKASSLIKPLPEWAQSIIHPILLSVFSTFVEWQGGMSPEQITPAKYAKNINIPVLQFHGTADNVISFTQGKNLHDNYMSNDKRFIAIEEAGHNNILVTDYPVYASMADWMLRVAD